MFRIRRRLLDRYLLVFAAALLITLMIPGRVQFKYDFDMDSPWRYQDLLAPFDFSILKTEAEFEEDQQLIRDQFLPYYERDPDVRNSVGEAYSGAFALRYPILKSDSSRVWHPEDSSLLLEAGLAEISRIYESGIIILDSSHAAWPEERSLYEIEGNQALEKRIQEYQRAERAAISNWSSQLTEVFPESVLDWNQELIRSVVRPDVFYKKQSSEVALADLLDQVSPNRGLIRKDTKVIEQGDIVDEDRWRVLNSLKEEYNRRSGSYQPYALRLGYFGMVGLVLLLFTLFLLHFNRDLIKKQRRLGIVLLFPVAFVALTLFSESQGFPTIFIIPYCIVPIVIRTFFGTRTALFTHLCVLLICGFLIPQSGEFMFLHLTAGLSAIFTNLQAQYWSRFFVAMAWLLVTYFSAWFATFLIQQGGFLGFDWMPFVWLTVNVFLCMMAYPLMLVFERLFGAISDITLRELGDLNRPLLQELSIKAPGTLQHSLQVANLAEAAVRKIGGNPLLAKVGCLYHDVGKLDKPAFFIENQQVDHNPHDQIDAFESASIIIGHVEKGVQMAKKADLPKQIIDFIRTHHGNTRVEYFWNKWKQGDENRANQSDHAFRYPGPLPQSRETAVAMVADSVEAAARAMKNPNAEKIQDLVDNIIRGKIQDGQFEQADISFREIAQVNKVFCKMLVSMHHSRIEYPGPAETKEKVQAGDSEQTEQEESA
jgi:putative nucleotidyltransferase with HDIG domain